MSVPMPSGLPPNAMRADSPPDDPPDVSLRFKGLTVRPNVLLTDSAYFALARALGINLITHNHHGSGYIRLAVPHRPEVLENVH